MDSYPAPAPRRKGRIVSRDFEAMILEDQEDEGRNVG